MISVNEMKNGSTIVYNNNLYQVLEFQHVKPGKGPAFVRTKLRNLKTQAIQDITFNSNEKVDPADVQKTKMQFLYIESTNFIFMNMTTYEQLEIDAKILENDRKYLKENMEISVISFGTEILGIILPEKIELLITDCEPSAKGDSKSGSGKNATTETGLTLRVPMFVQIDDRIIINTSTGNYDSRV